jgi:hypothetical protein
MECDHLNGDFRAIGFIDEFASNASVSRLSRISFSVILSRETSHQVAMNEKFVYTPD